MEGGVCGAVRLKCRAGAAALLLHICAIPEIRVGWRFLVGLDGPDVCECA